MPGFALAVCFCIQYEQIWLNNLERAALSINVVTLLSGLGLFTNHNAVSRNQLFAMMLSGLIVVTNLAFMAYIFICLARYSQYCTCCTRCRRGKRDDNEHAQGPNALRRFSLNDAQLQRRVLERVTSLKSHRVQSIAEMSRTMRRNKLSLAQNAAQTRLQRRLKHRKRQHTIVPQAIIALKKTGHVERKMDNNNDNNDDNDNDNNDDEDKDIKEEKKEKEKEMEKERLTAFNLPPNWKAILDVNSGRHYFHNIVTDMTTWDCPETTDAVPAPPPRGHVHNKQKRRSRGRQKKQKKQRGERTRSKRPKRRTSLSPSVVPKVVVVDNDIEQHRQQAQQEEENEDTCPLCLEGMPLGSSPLSARMPCCGNYVCKQCFVLKLTVGSGAICPVCRAVQ